MHLIKEWWFLITILDVGFLDSILNIRRVEMSDENMWRTIIERLARIEENTKKIDDMSSKANDAWHKASNNEADITELKENQKWTWRTIAGIVVSVIVMLISKFVN